MKNQERKRRRERNKTTRRRKKILRETYMAVSCASFRMVAFLGLIYATLISVACSQSIAPAPAPTSDGKYY